MFTQTDSGLVNIDHVSHVKTHVTRSGKERHTLYGTDGSSLGISDDPDFDPAAMAAPVIPAAPGATIIVIADPDPSRDQRPTAEDVWHEELPVFAWRCTPYGAEPIVACHADLTECKIFHIMPNGTLRCPGDCIYPDMPEAVAGTLRDAQYAWDLRHTVHAGAAQ